MNADLMNGTIVMSQNEARKAGRFGTDEYEMLAKLMQQFPAFRIEVVKPSAKRTDHVESHDSKKLADFYALCGLDESGKKQELAAAASYGELKMWFLEQFPEIEQMSENIRRIMDRTREARAARKAS